MNNKSASPEQKNALAKARAAFRAELETEDYQTLLDIMSYPVDGIIRRINRKSKTTPFWVSILILEGLILGLGFGISAAIGEAPGGKVQILELFNVLISFCFIILVKSYFDKLKKGFSSDFLEYVNSRESLENIKKWFARTTKRTKPLLWGVIFSVVFSSALAFYGPFLIYQIKGGLLGWGPTVLLLLANFPIGTGGYYLWISRDFRVQAKSWDFKIYEPDPSKSIAILKFSKLLSIPVLIIAFLAALTTLAFSITRTFSLPILAIAVICGWYPMLSIFIRNHIALASIISRAKEDKLIELQKMIADFEPKGLETREGIEYLHKLMDYHDRIAGTPNTALNFRITFGFVNTLLLPLATLLITNLGSIIKLFS
ncbi:MAG: hypothetical protein HY863_11485 [Chloroflexi bacterium]|nr:hypothetical protein [Chloroflexota bacterium]